MLREWMDQRRAAEVRSGETKAPEVVGGRTAEDCAGSLQAGTSVEAVGRIYGVNARQIYGWRKQHRQRVGKGKRSVLLPVHVAEGAPIVMPETKQECRVVIEARSVRVTMSGCIDAAVICTVLERLAG